MSEALILPQFMPPTVDLSNYALKSHSHSGYASSSHSHSSYATSSHTHDMSAYATQSWVTNNFAPKGSGGDGGDSSTSQTITITRKLPKGQYTYLGGGGSENGTRQVSCKGTISSARLDSVTISPSTGFVSAGPSSSFPTTINPTTFAIACESGSSIYMNYGFRLRLTVTYSGSVISTHYACYAVGDGPYSPYTLDSDITITMKVTVYF